MRATGAWGQPCNSAGLLQGEQTAARASVAPALGDAPRNISMKRKKVCLPAGPLRT